MCVPDISALDQSSQQKIRQAYIVQDIPDYDQDGHMVVTGHQRG